MFNVAFLFMCASSQKLSATFTSKTHVLPLSTKYSTVSARKTHVHSLLKRKLTNLLERVASWTIREHQRFFGALVNAKNASRPVPASASSRPRCLGHNRDREEG